MRSLFSPPSPASVTSSVLAATIFLAAASPAHAQEAPPPPPAAPAAPATAGAQPASGYATPLYQQVQPSYVPQSVAMSGPRLISDWEEGQPIPPGYHPDTRIRKGLVIAGGVIFGTMYFFSALAAAVGSDSAGPGQGNPEAALWIPGVGPFIQMTSTSSATGNVFLALDGLCQAGGLAMAIYGLAAPKTVLVRNDLGGLHLTPMPMTFGRNGEGLGVVGTF
jgi:hypothetical protein